MVIPVHLATRVPRVTPDPVDSLELLEYQDQGASLEQLDRLAIKDQLAIPEHKAQEVIQDRMEQLEQLEPLDRLEV